MRALLVPYRLVFHKILLISLVCLGFSCILIFTQRSMADDTHVVPDAPGSIAGVVTNAASIPMAGIEITAFQQTSYGAWQTVRMVQTDQTGAYRIGLLGAGVYRLLFSDPTDVLAQTYYANATNIETATDIPVAGTNVTNINVTLAAGGRITGTITNTGSSTPSSYYAVRAFQQVGVQWVNVRAIGLAPQQGVYSLTGLPDGVYRVCTSSAYLPDPYSSIDPFQECYDDVYAVNDATDVRVKAGETTPNINFVLGDGADLAQLSGQVTTNDGTPLPKISVTAVRLPTYIYGWTQFTQTNSAGIYQLRNLLPGVYAVSFSDNTGAFVSEFYSDVLTIDAATPLTLTHREKRTNVDAKLTIASHITGTLLIKDEGPPLYGNATVYQQVGKAWQPFYPSVNRFDPTTGQYQVHGLPAGVYKVGGYGYGGNYPYQGFYGGKTLEEAALITLTVGETKTNVAILLTQPFSNTPYSGQISGTVTANGAPVAGIKLSLYQTNCCVYPPQIPPTPAVTPVPIPTVTPAVNRTNAVAASQVNDPHTDATTSDVKPLVYVYTDAQGHYVIDGLPDGQYFLGVSDPTGLYATAYYNNRPLLQHADSFSLQGGRVFLPNIGLTSSMINLALVRGGGISGNVQVKEGTPVANVAVEVFVYSDQFRWELLTIDNVTDAAGNYTIKGLPEGNYRLCFVDLTGKYPLECDGSVDYNTVDNGNGVVVKADIIATVNHILGPKLKFFLPFVNRETFCAEITEISRGECEALFAIYKNSNQYNSPISFFGWFKNNQPCQWVGITCEANSVTSLFLASMGLVTLPAQIGNFTHLQSLTLSSNLLLTLPDEIGNLANLQRLALSNIGMTAVPKTLGRLHNLQWLDMSLNPVTSIAPELGDLTNLELLALSQANLPTLPAFLGRLTNLRELYLPQNQLTTISADLGQLKNLQRLDLSGNQLTTLPAVLGKLSNLQKLNVSSNQLTALPIELGNLSNLQILYLNHNPQLSGAIPLSFTKFHLNSFWFIVTNLCEPTASAFQTWLNQIPDLLRSGLHCDVGP